MLKHVSYQSTAAKHSLDTSSVFLKISASRTTKPKFRYSRIQTKTFSVQGRTKRVSDNDRKRENQRASVFYLLSVGQKKSFLSVTVIRDYFS